MRRIWSVLACEKAASGKESVSLIASPATAAWLQQRTKLTAKQQTRLSGGGVFQILKKHKRNGRGPDADDLNEIRITGVTSIIGIANHVLSPCGRHTQSAGEYGENSCCR